MTQITGHWNHFLESVPSERQDVYFREEYVRLYETDNEKSCSFVYQEGENTFVLPFLCRTFEFDGKVYHDFETAYGYGGPVSNNHDESFMSRALEAFKSLLADENFVCGFVRFHPVLANWRFFDKVGRVISDRKTIAINLSGGVNAVWMDEIHTKNRNVIKKGEKYGLKFVADYDFVYLNDFVQLYNSTMSRLDADDFYFFGPEYYKRLRDNIKNRFLGIVKIGDKVVAGAIFMYQGPYGHYHLAGSDKSALQYSPNNFLLWEAAKELISENVTLFHLGGGTDGSEDNTLLQYKRKFSRNEYQFSIGKVIFNQNIYDDICSSWASQNPEKSERFKNILLKYKY